MAARSATGESASAASPSLALRTRSSAEPGSISPTEDSTPLPPGVLRSQMEKAGLTNGEFSAIFGISPNVLQDWLGGHRPVPSWVLPTIQMLYLLSPAVRQRLLQEHPLRESVDSPPSEPKRIRSHPFSRIEDL